MSDKCMARDKVLVDRGVIEEMLFDSVVEL